MRSPLSIQEERQDLAFAIKDIYQTAVDAGRDMTERLYAPATLKTKSMVMNNINLRDFFFAMETAPYAQGMEYEGIGDSVP